MLPPSDSVAPFAPRPSPPSPSPSPHPPPSRSSTPSTTQPAPPLPPKLPPPPPPPSQNPHRFSFPPSTSTSTPPRRPLEHIVDFPPSSSPTSATRKLRQRASFDASNTGTPTRSAATTSTFPPHRSRSTSVDYGAYSAFDIVDSLSPDLRRGSAGMNGDGAGGNGNGDTILLFDRDKDLPLADGDEEDEDDSLLGNTTTRGWRRHSITPSGRNRHRRHPSSSSSPRSKSAKAARLACRALLVLAALLATAMLLRFLLSGEEIKSGLGEIKDKVKGKVQGAFGSSPSSSAASSTREEAQEGSVLAQQDEEEAAEVGEPKEMGGDGDWVRLENGTVVQYRNAFGGTFSTSPLSLAARAQDDSPPLSEEWDFERGRMRGVNLGGWLTLEPFITPSLFESYLNDSSPAVDEWTLSENLRREGGEERLEEVLRGHYETFITELDFLAIAAAGLNWVRLPVPYWAIRTWSSSASSSSASSSAEEQERRREAGAVDEPFLEGVAWEYVLEAVTWARKYGLRLNLDLHSVPGSQNGWNHSGRLGAINVLHGVMGRANAERALDYVASVAEWTMREEVRPIVPMYSLLNEPMLAVIGPGALRSFYMEAYETVRNITGYGRGNGPFLAFHDGFKGTRRWYNFLEDTSSPSRSSSSRSLPPAPPSPADNADEELEKRWKNGGSLNGLDRVALDSHRYLAFAEPDLRSVREQVMKPCLKWAPEFNKTAISFGLALSGEFALAVTDCGRFLNNVFEGTRLEGTFPTPEKPLYPPSAPLGTCQFWEDYPSWTDEFKADLRDLALAQMDTFQNWFYWTWKTTPSSLQNPSLAVNPLWSYSLGLSEGFIPSDPRKAHDFCYSYPSSPVALAANASEAARETPKRYPLGKLEGWKVGDAVSRPGGATADEVGRVSAETKARAQVTWPPVEFDAPGGEYGAGGQLVAGLPRYERTGRGVYLPSPSAMEGKRRPRALTVEEEAERERLGRGRKWAEPIRGCRYPEAWRAVELGVMDDGHEPWCTVEGAVEGTAEEEDEGEREGT